MSDMDIMRDWMISGAPYIMIMKSGSQHCLVVSSVSDSWIFGNAGITKYICLYEDDDGTLKLVVDDGDSIKVKVGTKQRLLIRQCVVRGPEMLARVEEISIAEKSVAVYLKEECFDLSGNIVPDVVVGAVPELQKYWVPGNGFEAPKENLQISRED